ncbi:unnamed protein product, partial [Prorocentrum cordatum]
MRSRSEREDATVAVTPPGPPLETSISTSTLASFGSLGLTLPLERGTFECIIPHGARAGSTLEVEFPDHGGQVLL